MRIFRSKAEKYFRRMKKISDEFVQMHNIQIGERYQGRHFTGGGLVVGKLVEVSASDDGIFACIETEKGRVIEDIEAMTLYRRIID